MRTNEQTTLGKLTVLGGEGWREDGKDREREGKEKGYKRKGQKGGRGGK